MSNASRRLRGERKVEARGQLTIDRDAAREKLRLFRLPDPHYYVLQFVRVASVLGCGNIMFEFSAGNMTCTFDRELPTERFDDFWASSFQARNTPEDIAMHNLALGIGSAQALRPREIRVLSGRREIVFRGDEEEVVDGDHRGTRITLTEKFRFGHLLDYFVVQAEAMALRRHCAMSTLLVFVNGECVQQRTGEFPVTFKDGHGGDGFVALRGVGRAPLLRGLEVFITITYYSEFHFLRDDVLVRTHPIATQTRDVHGVVNSRVLQTDLSGLALTPSAELDGLLFEKLYDAYHVSLLKWLEADPDHATKLDLVEVGTWLFSHVARLNRMGFDVPPGTRKLVAWWLDQRVFVRADGGGVARVSAREATSEDGQIAVSHAVYPEQSLPEFPVVLLWNTEVGRVIIEVANAGFTVTDVTDRLGTASVAARNRKQWERRPSRPPVKWDVQCDVKLRGRAVGHLFVPIDDGGRLDQSHVGLATYSDRRLISRVSSSTPIGMVIDGDLVPNKTHSGVERDATHQQLARALVRQLPGLLRDLTRRAEADRDGLYRAKGVVIRLFYRLLSRFLTGALSYELFELLGYDRPSAEAWVDDAVHEDTLVRELLQKLGPVADAPLFQNITGGWRSLSWIAAPGAPPILIDSWPLAAEVALLGVAALRIFVVTADTSAILRRVRPDAQIGAKAVARIRAEAAFMRGAPYEPDAVPVLERVRESLDTTSEPLDVVVELLGPGRTCDVKFVYRERLLATRTWDAKYGRFRAVLRSDGFRPTDEYLDIVCDHLYVQAETWTRTLMERALASWAERVLAQPRVAGEKFHLFWERALGESRFNPARDTIPVWQRGDAGWIQSYVSLHALRRAVKQEGGILHVVRGDAVPGPEAAGHPIVLHAPQGGEIPGELFNGDVKIVEVTDDSDPEEQRIAFLMRTAPVQPVSGALFTSRTVVEGLDFEIAVLDPAGGPDENAVVVIWEERRLETIVEPVRFGRFETRVRGALITPDPGYQFVVSPRGQILRAAQVAAQRALRALCELIEARGATPLAELEPMRIVLLRALAASHHEAEQFAWRAVLPRSTLQALPLFDLADGSRLAWTDLELLAVEGVVPYCSQPGDDRALLIDPDELTIYEAALGEKLTTLPASEVDFVLGVQAEEIAGERPRFHRDDLLDAVAAMLVAARGTDMQLFDDALAYGLAWDDQVDQLCVVSPARIAVHPDHPLVEACRVATDDAPLRFLASVIYTSVNAHYREITDRDELELVRRLIR